MQLISEVTELTAFGAHCGKKAESTLQMGSGNAAVKLVNNSLVANFYTALWAAVIAKRHRFRATPLALQKQNGAQVDVAQLSFENSSVNKLSFMHKIAYIGLARRLGLC